MIESYKAKADSDCSKAKELISGAVDGELSAREYSYFDRHVKSCKTCRNEFELEKLTQLYFKDRVRLLDPPDGLIDSIRSRLSEEDQTRVSESRIPQPSFRRYLWPAVGIAAVLVFAVTILFTINSRKETSIPPQQLSVTTTPQTKDALSFSEFNFLNLLNGEFNPQIKSHEAADVINFIKQKAGYSIPLPTVRNVDWIGGSVTALESEKAVDVIYKAGSAFIYIYAFPTTLAHSNVVSLSLECIKALDENEWFWSKGSKGNLQVVWKSEDHVCVLTSNLDKKELTTYLKTIKGFNDSSWH
jgi:hypothetical protein